MLARKNTVMQDEMAETFPEEAEFLDKFDNYE